MSRKNKILRAFLYQNQNPTIEQAWDAAWKHAQKIFHARSMQDMEERLDASQAECERLRKDVASLVEALEDVGASWHGEGYMRNVARRALAAYRKQGEKP